MKGSEFLKKIRDLGRRKDTSVRLESKRGKASHATLYYGSKRTVIQELKKELPKGTLHAMLDQLGISLKELQ
jgi:mRNA interferase HicA